MIYEKTDKPGFYKDTVSGAVINRDTKALELYRLKRLKQTEMKERQERIEAEVFEIKQMLSDVITKLTEK